MGSEELSLVLREHTNLYQVAEKLTSLDKLHQEVDTKLVLEDVLHINEEWVVDLAQNVLLELDVFHLLVLQDYVLPDTLHGVEFVRSGVLYQEDLTKGALADHLTDLEIFQRRRLLRVSSKDSGCAASHGLAHFHAVLVGGLRAAARHGCVRRQLLASNGLLSGKISLTRC